MFGKCYEITRENTATGDAIPDGFILGLALTSSPLTLAMRCEYPIYLFLFFTIAKKWILTVWIIYCYLHLFGLIICFDENPFRGEHHSL